ncbi:hypothetical protein DVH24_020015 [Malus domestica]|uniref:Uncharacterized protein n=1 Tax=Malus domestica TaxID=3750 RepID=A0A498KU67_MALDO|nr:hypothetical protein DVH24_034102 [Malus domestica]RXI09944.1 hypothetical protein DVH24_020015 [Malus domestica]
MGGGVLGFSKSGMSSRTRGGQSRLLGRRGGRQGRRDVGDVKKFGDVRITGERERESESEGGEREMRDVKKFAKLGGFRFEIEEGRRLGSLGRFRNERETCPILIIFMVFTKNVNLTTPPSVAEPFEDQTGTGPS